MKMYFTMYTVYYCMLFKLEIVNLNLKSWILSLINYVNIPLATRWQSLNKTRQDSVIFYGVLAENLLKNISSNTIFFLRSASTNK